MVAETVVLAAGAYGSPAILQRSGVGDPTALDAVGIETAVSSFRVWGEISTIIRPSSSIRGLRPPSTAPGGVCGGEISRPRSRRSARYARAAATGPYDLHVFPVAGHPHSLMAGRVVIAVAALEPVPEAGATVVGPDPEAAPRFDHGYLSDPGRASTSLCSPKAAERGRELAATEPLAVADRCRDRTEPRRARSSSSSALLPPGRYVRDGGESDPIAVCDGAGRVRGWPQVVVADCSLMPTSPAPTPTCRPRSSASGSPTQSSPSARATADGSDGRDRSEPTPSS